MHLEEIVRVFNTDPAEPIAWANVVARAKSAFFLVNYVVLLGAALFHGFYGLRNIVFELNPGAGDEEGGERRLLVDRRPRPVRGRHVGGLDGVPGRARCRRHSISRGTRRCLTRIFRPR